MSSGARSQKADGGDGSCDRQSEFVSSRELKLPVVDLPEPTSLVRASGYPLCGDDRERRERRWGVPVPRTREAD